MPFFGLYSVNSRSREGLYRGDDTASFTPQTFTTCNLSTWAKKEAAAPVNNHSREALGAMKNAGDILGTGSKSQVAQASKEMITQRSFTRLHLAEREQKVVRTQKLGVPQPASGEKDVGS